MSASSALRHTVAPDIMSQHFGPMWSSNHRAREIGGRLYAACDKRDAAGGVHPDDLAAWSKKASELVQREKEKAPSPEEHAASAAHKDKLLSIIGGMLPHQRAAVRARLKKRAAWLSKNKHKQHLPRIPVKLLSEDPSRKKLITKMNIPKGHQLAISSRGAKEYNYTGAMGPVTGFSNYAKHIPSRSERTGYTVHVHPDPRIGDGPLRMSGGRLTEALRPDPPAHHPRDRMLWKSLGGGNLNALGRAQTASIPLGLRARIGDGNTTMRFPGGSPRLSIMNIQVPTQWAPPLVSNFGQSIDKPLENIETVWPGGEDPLNKFIENKRAGAYVRGPSGMGAGSGRRTMRPMGQVR